MIFYLSMSANVSFYSLSLHDALPILVQREQQASPEADKRAASRRHRAGTGDQPARNVHLQLARRSRGGNPLVLDRKSTRLNSSHLVISYAVFCLKKKKNNHYQHINRA